MPLHKHLRRLDRVWIEPPIYFLTTCTHGRRRILTHAKAADILIEEWRQASIRFRWAIGRYVIMPDHVHFFSSPVDFDPQPVWIHATVEAVDEQENSS